MPRHFVRLPVVAVAVLLFTVLPPAYGAVTFAAGSQVSAQGVVDESRPRVSGELIVKYRSDASSEDRQNLRQQHRLAHAMSINALGLNLLKTAPGDDELTIVRRLQADPRVELVEPNYKVYASAVPTDPSYSQQWDMSLIGMEQAWNVSTGSSSVITAVIDTGVDAAHPDLAGRIANLTGSGLPGADHVFLTSPAASCGTVTTPDDDAWNGSSHISHGTHVSGTILANSTLNGSSAVGVAGVAPSTRIAPLKALDCEGSGTNFDVASAISFAATHGASVINLSLGSDGDVSSCDGTKQTAINLAHSNGVFVAAAAGNDGSTNRSDPAICSFVVGVGATDISDNIASFSQHNSTVDLSAPGVAVLSTLRDSSGNRTYGYLQGTSMATPHVAGCAALVRSVNSSLTPDAVETLLRNTSVDLGTAGRDDFFGSGRLDCGAAVSSAAGITVATRTPSPTSSTGGTAGPCSSIGAGSISPPISAPANPSGPNAGAFGFQSLGEAQTTEATGPLAVPPGWTSITCEGFEGAWPSTGWSLVESGSGGAGVCWGPTSFQARYGTKSAWPAAQACSNPGLNPATSNYPNNLQSRATFGPFSLADASAAQAEITAWRQLADADVFFFGASNDGSNFLGFNFTGNSTASAPPTTDGWQSFTLNLADSNPNTGINLVGSPNVWILLLFQSNAGGSSRGVFVDDVLVTKRLAATSTPTPTSTATLTPTPTGPTSTPTMSLTPLPCLKPGCPPTTTPTNLPITSTPSSTSTPSTTPTASSTGTPTATPSPTSSLSASQTPTPTPSITQTPHGPCLKGCPDATDIPTITPTPSLTPTQAPA